MRSLILLLFFGLIAILMIPLLLVCALFRWQRPVMDIGKLAVRLGRMLLGIRVEVTGIERIDSSQPYVFMPNHMSMLDGPLMFIVIPQFVRVILKKQIFRVPILAQGMKLVEFIPVDRQGRQGGRRAVEKAARLIRERGCSFLIFPEGTRTHDGKLQPFRRGGFFLALQAGVPIVPVSIAGTYELMPRSSFRIKSGAVKVTFHPPVAIDEYDETSMPQLMDRVREMVKAGLRESASADAHKK